MGRQKSLVLLGRGTTVAEKTDLPALFPQEKCVFQKTHTKKVKPTKTTTLSFYLIPSHAHKAKVLHIQVLLFAPGMLSEVGMFLK